MKNKKLHRRKSSHGTKASIAAHIPGLSAPEEDGLLLYPVRWQYLINSNVATVTAENIETEGKYGHRRFTFRRL